MSEKFSKIDNYILQLVRASTPKRTAWNMEHIRRNADTTWNYIDGCMMNALLQIAETTGEKEYLELVLKVADCFIGEDGSIQTFKAENKNLDDINEGRILFEVYRITGEEKYKKAADFLYECLKNQPRTPEGNFWHKLRYPNQIWLDGLYMAQPFLALYEKNFGSGDIGDTVRQIKNVVDLMRDSETGLYYHGYDSSREMYWADKKTGLSKNFWLRSIGWFAVALVDLIEIAGEGKDRDTLSEIFRDLMDSIYKFVDPETGMYYQVVNFPGREGNYLETSGSAMIAYAELKGSRLKVLKPCFYEYGKKTFEGIIRKYLSEENESLKLSGICLVAGLGDINGKKRDGTYEYYLSEPVVSDDAKGIAPFVLAYSEIIRS